MKNSKVWKKKYGRYIRVIQDAEGSIMLRDSAIRDYAEKINSTPEEGFFNRSITMVNHCPIPISFPSYQVLGKVAPNESMKKQHDKCRTLVHEIDLIENDLSELTSVLRHQQEEYNISLSNALQEIESIENERLNFIKTGLLRFYQANNGMSDHLTQIFEHLKSLISTLDIHVDVETFERELELAKSSFRERSNSMQQHLAYGIATDRNSGEIPLLENTYPTQQLSGSPISDSSMPLQIAASSRYKSEDDEASKLLRSNFMIFDRLKDGIDCLKKSAQRATGTFAEISDAEKQYSKSALKVLEKHGYAVAGHITHTTTNKISNSFASPDSKLRDLVNLYESSFCRAGWDNVTQVTEKLSEAHLTVAEVLLDKCCVITDNAQRKMDGNVKEATDKVHQINKKIDGAKASQMRLKSKLNRVQKELKDRRIAANSPRKALREDTSDSGNISLSQHQGGIVDGGESERFSDLSPNDQSLGKKSNNPGSELVDTNHSSHPPFSMQKAKSEKGMIQGWESLGNAFGVVAVTALGAAGVLESSSERNNSRIANLEEEEAACLESLNTVAASTQVVVDLCVNDLSAIIMSLKQGLSKEMENLKSSLMLFIDGHTVGLNISINVLARLKYATDSIDIQQDISHFRANIIVATLANEERKHPNPFSLPPVEEFVRLRNDIVDLERLDERESQNSIDNEQLTLSPTSPSENRNSTTPSSPRHTFGNGNDSREATDEALPSYEFETTVAPLENPLDCLSDAADMNSEGFAKIEANEKLPMTLEVSTQSYSDSINLSHAPIVAPSECSIPDYNEETLQEVHDEDIKAKAKKLNPTENSRQDPNTNTTTFIIQTSSHEIGTFSSSSQDGLRRSVTTEHHIGRSSDMHQVGSLLISHFLNHCRWMILPILL